MRTMSDDFLIPAASGQPRRDFDWPIYADATLAGLSVLIPIPLLDWLFEQFFRRRMAPSIAARRGRALPDPIRDELNRSEGSCLGVALALPLKGVLWLARRISRKLLYFLTVKDAADQLAYYWQRAFLIDHMLDLGHLDDPASARVARRALDQALDATSGPLLLLARQIISHSRGLVGTLCRARRGVEDEAIRQAQGEMSRQWSTLAAAFELLGARYDEWYRRVQAEPERQA